eukprot:PhM_4_TR5625/c0_g1_i1/m.62015
MSMGSPRGGGSRRDTSHLKLTLRHAREAAKTASVRILQQNAKARRHARDEHNFFVDYQEKRKAHYAEYESIALARCRERLRQKECYLRETLRPPMATSYQTLALEAAKRARAEAAQTMTREAIEKASVPEWTLSPVPPISLEEVRHRIEFLDSIQAGVSFVDAFGVSNDDNSNYEDEDVDDDGVIPAVDDDDDDALYFSTHSETPQPRCRDREEDYDRCETPPLCYSRLDNDHDYDDDESESGKARDVQREEVEHDGDTTVHNALQMLKGVV